MTSFDIIALLKSKQIEASNISGVIQINPDTFVSSWDEIQIHFECCGAHGTHGYAFWLNFEPYHGIKSLPESCCIRPVPHCAEEIIGQTLLAANVCANDFFACDHARSEIGD